MAIWFDKEDGVYRLECPACHSRNIIGFSTVEVLYGTSSIDGFDPETMRPNYRGGVELNWNGQKAVMSKSGQVRLHCDECGHMWWQTLPAPQQSAQVTAPLGSSEAIARVSIS